jgi:hypothetical protein
MMTTTPGRRLRLDSRLEERVLLTIAMPQSRPNRSKKKVRKRLTERVRKRLTEIVRKRSIERFRKSSKRRVRKCSTEPVRKRPTEEARCRRTAGLGRETSVQSVATGALVIANRVTRRVCKKIAQNDARNIFLLKLKHNLYSVKEQPKNVG